MKKLFPLVILLLAFVFLASPQKALAQCKDWCYGPKECMDKYGEGYVCRQTGCDPVGVAGDCIKAEPSEISDQEKCEGQGGKWDPREGYCTAKSPEETGLCAALTCSPGSIKKVLSRELTTQLSICGCYEVLFSGQSLYIRAQECSTNIVSKPGDYESDPVMAMGIKTALGCIPYEPGPLVAWIFGLAVSIGGGLAFLIMGVGAFLFITSQGNPEQIQKGKEIMVSAGAGLLFIIFSVFLLRLIGVDILKIPGFQ